MVLRHRVGKYERAAKQHDWYTAAIYALRDHRIWTMGMGFLAFVATIFAFGTLPMSFQPTIDTDFSQVKIETVPGSTLQQTTAITRKVADMLAADKDMVEAALDRQSVV